MLIMTNDKIMCSFQTLSIVFTKYVDVFWLYTEKKRIYHLEILSRCVGVQRDLVVEYTDASIIYR